MFDHFFFPSAGYQLYGALHKPTGQPLGAAVLCAPFAEEQKTTYRIYAQLADRLAAAGWAALQFDYRGTGDSSGSFVQFSPSAAVEDIHAAIALARERSGAERVGLFGLRLGASFALQVAQTRQDIDWLALWEPITSGEEFFKLNIKRQLVRQMLIRSAAKKAGTEPAATKAADANFIDLDGYPLSKAACDELRQITLPPAQPTFARPMLLVQISTSDRPLPEHQALADAYRLGGNFRTYVAEPFWNRIGIIDCSALIELTVSWLQGR